MDGRHTIIITLQLYFRVSEEKVFDSICDLLLFYLTDESDENPHKAEDMEAEIETLAREFAPNNQDDWDTIKKDLLKLVINWWHIVTWAQQEIRLSIEKEEFIADLLAPIVAEIKNDSYGSRYYKPIVLEALLQMINSSCKISNYVRQRLPQNINLNDALQYYQKFSDDHHFSKECPVLLELLSIKLARNAKRHLSYLFKDYRADCRQSGNHVSYDDYISYRGLTISPEQSVICKNLFENELKTNPKPFSYQTY
jgi:hypothetical protein